MKCHNAFRYLEDVSDTAYGPQRDIAAEIVPIMIVAPYRY